LHGARLVPLDRLGKLGGNMRSLWDWPFQVFGLRIARGRALAVREARRGRYVG